MALSGTTHGDHNVTGNLTLGGNLVMAANGQLVGPSGIVTRSGLYEDSLAVYPVPFTQMRVWDAMTTPLPQTASADDLAIIEHAGAYPVTDPVVLQGVDFGATSTTAYARWLFPLPVEYVSGADIQVRVIGGILTTVADTSLTVDIEAFAYDDQGTAGTVTADLCTTSATTINTLLDGTNAVTVDFTITATSRSAGDVLDVRLTVAGTDSGNLGVMIPEIVKVAMLLDVKG